MLIWMSMCAVVGALDAQPPNDLQSNAEELIVRLGGQEYYTLGTNVGATDEGETPSPTCTSGATRDVWYSFTAPENVSGTSLVAFRTRNVTNGTGLMMQVLDSVMQNEVYCTPMVNTNKSKTLNSGETYFLRFYDYEFDGLQTGTFEIAVLSPDAPEMSVSLDVSQISCFNAADGAIDATVQKRCLSSQLQLEHWRDNGGSQ